MSYTLISTQSLNSSVSNVTFSNIPQTYTDLYLVISARADLSGNGISSYVTINGSATGFNNRRLYGNGATASSNSDSVPNYFGDINGTSTTSNVFTTSSVYIPNYTSANYKSYEIQTIVENNNTTAYDMLVSGVWSNIAAITSFSFTLQSSANFVQYSTASLYGINRIPTASLGAAPNVEYLVVAGGGGGGTNAGGGGGAGGLLTGSAFSVASGTPITVTVGAGGASATGGAGTYYRGTNGSNSVFSTLTAIGGGAGGVGGAISNNTSLHNGADGGSGGGASAWSTQPGPWTGGAATSGQGYKGGNATTTNGSNNFIVAGGGGAGGAAPDQSSSNALNGAGGAGVTTTITGSTLALASGGAGYLNTTPTEGGGGAYGVATKSSTGGGGGSDLSGGSGVVIIRYPDIYANPTATTGNPVVNYSNGYKIYTWTSSGSITF